MRAGLNWDDLRFALAAAREGSFSGAARAMNVAVTTVSRRIDALEEQLEVRLFTRTFEGLELTASGAELVEHMHSIEDRVLALEREALGQSEEISGVVRVSTIEPVAADLIAPALPAFSERFPDIELIILSEQQWVDLARREADLAIRMGKPRGNGLLIRRLAHLEFGLYAAPAYLERHGAPEDPITSLAGHRLITYDDRFTHLPEAAWMHVRSQDARFVLRASSLRVLEQAIGHGLGLGVLPDVMAAPDLVRLVGPEHFPRRPVWMVRHPDTAHVPRIQVTADFLTELILARMAELGAS